MQRSSRIPAFVHSVRRQRTSTASCARVCSTNGWRVAHIRIGDMPLHAAPRSPRAPTAAQHQSGPHPMRRFVATHRPRSHPPDCTLRPMIGLRRALRPLKRANLFPVLTQAARHIAQTRQVRDPFSPCRPGSCRQTSNNRRSPSAAGSFTAGCVSSAAHRHRSGARRLRSFSRRLTRRGT